MLAAPQGPAPYCTSHKTKSTPLMWRWSPTITPKGLCNISPTIFTDDISISCPPKLSTCWCERIVQSWSAILNQGYCPLYKQEGARDSWPGDFVGLMSDTFYFSSPSLWNKKRAFKHSSSSILKHFSNECVLIIKAKISMHTLIANQFQ